MWYITCNLFYACSILYTCLYGIYYISFIYIQSYTCNLLYHTLQFVIYKIPGEIYILTFPDLAVQGTPVSSCRKWEVPFSCSLLGIPQILNGWENGRWKWEGLFSCSRKIGGKNWRGKWEGPFSCSSEIGWENRRGKWEGKMGGAIFLYPYDWNGPLPSCTSRYGNVRMTVCPWVDVITFDLICCILIVTFCVMCCIFMSVLHAYNILLRIMWTIMCYVYISYYFESYVLIVTVCVMCCILLVCYMHTIVHMILIIHVLIIHATRNTLLFTWF